MSDNTLTSDEKSALAHLRRVSADGNDIAGSQSIAPVVALCDRLFADNADLRRKLEEAGKEKHDILEPLNAALEEAEIVVETDYGDAVHELMKQRDEYRRKLEEAEGERDKQASAYSAVKDIAIGRGRGWREDRHARQKAERENADLLRQVHESEEHVREVHSVNAELHSQLDALRQQRDAAIAAQREAEAERERLHDNYNDAALMKESYRSELQSKKAEFEQRTQQWEAELKRADADNAALVRAAEQTIETGDMQILRDTIKSGHPGRTLLDRVKQAEADAAALREAAEEVFIARNAEGNQHDNAAILGHAINKLEEVVESPHPGAPLLRENARLREAVKALGSACDEYRRMHDVHGDGSVEAGRAWDQMRKASNEAVAALQSPHPAPAIGGEGEAVKSLEDMRNEGPPYLSALSEQGKEQVIAEVWACLDKLKAPDADGTILNRIREVVRQRDEWQAEHKRLLDAVQPKLERLPATQRVVEAARAVRFGGGGGTPADWHELGEALSALPTSGKGGAA